MNIFTYLLISTGAFAVLNYFLIPNVEGIPIKDNPAKEISRAGLIAVLNYFRTNCQILIITYLAILAVLFIANVLFTDATSIDKLQHASDLANVFKNKLVGVKHYFGPFNFLIAIIALGILSCLDERQNMTSRFAKIRERELERLNKKWEEKKWENLPSTDEMLAIEAQIKEEKEKAVAIQRLVQDGHLAEDQAVALIQELAENISQLQEMWIRLDWIRRMDLTYYPKEDDEKNNEAKSYTWWPKIRLFLISKRLFDRTRTAGKVFSYAATALLLISLLGISTPFIEQAIDMRLTHIDDLWKLKIDANHREVDAAWEKAKKEWKGQNQNTQAPQNIPGKWSAADKLILRELARHFVINLALSKKWQVAPEQAAITKRLRTEFVKDQIIAKTVQSAPQNSRLRMSPLFGKTDQVKQFNKISDEEIAKQAAVLQTVRGPVLSESPDVPLIQTTNQWLEAAVQDLPSPLWKKIRNKVQLHIQQYYGEPASAFDFANVVLSESVDAAIGNIIGQPNTELQKQINSLISKGTQEVAKRAFEIQFKQYLIDLAGPGSFQSALDRIKKEGFGSSVMTGGEAARLQSDIDEVNRIEKELASRAKRYPPAFVLAKDNAPEPLLINQLLKQYAQNEESLHQISYENIFPGQVGTNAETELATEMMHLDPNLRSESSQNAEKLAVSFERAREYAQLNSFRRIGGVLIGLDPEARPAGQAINFKDIRWLENDGKLYLIFKPVNGKEIVKGPYHRDIVHQALAYAADGRPITVTMVATPIYVLKILLHPTLVDTKLGADAINIDRLVDTFATDEYLNANNQIQTKKFIYAQGELYDFAWNHRKLAISTDDSIKEIKYHIEEIKDDLNTFQEKNENFLTYLKRTKLLKTDQSVLSFTPYFDQDLVQQMQWCIDEDKSGSLDEFGTCIEAKSKASLETDNGAQAQVWQSAPPDFRVWGGVREQEYYINSSLDSIPSHAIEGWPFRFILQASFMTDPQFTQSGVNPDLLSSAWTLPGIDRQIGKAVLAGIQKTAQFFPLQSAFDNMREFTELQRLFRFALAGGLGDRFPIEKLVALSGFSASKNSFFHTPRWNHIEDSRK